MLSTNELLLKWLNEEIKLNPPVKNITKEFYTGYKFAQILYNLKDITEKQFNAFSSSEQTYEIKNNFSLLKKFFQKLYKLEIRKEEFQAIINKEKFKAGIMLYRLKNSIAKKNINFLDIKISADNLSVEEINKKVKEIIDYEYFYDIFNKDLLYDIIDDEKKKKEFNTFLSSSIKSSKSSGIQSKLKMNSKNNFINFSFKRTISHQPNQSNQPNPMIEEKPELNLKLKFMEQQDYESHTQQFSKKLLYLRNQNGGLNNINYSSRNMSNQSSNYSLINNSIESKKKEKSLVRLPKIKHSLYKSAQILTPLKKDKLTKFNSSLIPKRNDNNNENSTFITSYMNNYSRTLNTTRFRFGDGKSNIAEDNKFRISELTDSLLKFGLCDFKSFFKNVLPEFNPLNKKELNKVKDELKKRIRIKREDSIKKQEKEIKIRIYDIPEIDFVHRDKDKLKQLLNDENKFSLGTSMQNHNKYLTLQKRLKYSKEWIVYYNQKLMEKKIKQFLLLIKKTNKNKEKNEKYVFEKEKYLTDLCKEFNVDNFNNLLIKKRLQFEKDIYYIRNIILLIVDMTMEIFLYQEEKENELIDIETYTKLLELFIKNKPMRERVVDKEARIIKEREVEKEQVNPDKLKLTEKEINLKEDYKNYIGMWNDDKIMKKEMKGMKLEFKKVNTYFPKDYEPTEGNIQDLIFPVYNPENYLYGDVFLELLDNKYLSTIKNADIKKGGKWDYINYKISLIGLPFCGKKFIAGEICQKFPNLKIYSVQKIFRNYYEQYKSITEPIDNNSKYKSLKPNQIEQMKKDKEKQLTEFEPILQIIQPYINSINENITDKDNNKDQGQEQEQDDKLIIPNDEVLLNILIYNIENDFPKKQEEEIVNEIIDRQTNIFNLIQQKEKMEKQIQENKKPNPKDEQSILNIEKDIQNIKNNSVKGFILVDFPTNINQCNLLEHYLNGYIDETKKPKTQNMINVKTINSLIDFNFAPNGNTKLKKSGIDFIVNIITNEDDVNERFNKKKYDPVNDKIYSENELNQDIIIKDKKLLERLTDNIPYYTNKHFDYYKKEYYNNIAEINLFYNMFGFSEKNTDLDLNISGINPEKNNKEEYKTYQEINTKEDNKKEGETINVDIEEKKEINKNANNINNNNANPTTAIKKDDEIKNKILNFINENIIGYLLKEKNEEEKTIYYTKYPELNDEEEKDKINFNPEFQINEINRQSTKRGISTKDKLVPKYTMENFDIVLSDLKKFNKKYEKYCGKFIHLIEKQKKNIYVRLNLIQKKYREFLNQKSDKKEVITMFCEKYNNFFREFPGGFNSETAINEFTQDIDELNTTLWFLINIKETVSIKELQEIKNSNFIEYELKKFYKNVKDIFLLEAEKFLVMINSIINLYQKKFDDSSNTLISLVTNTNKEREREREKEKVKTNNLKKEYILNNLVEIKDTILIEENENGEEENHNIDKISNNINNYYMKKKKEPDDVDYLINKNVDLIFKNCMNLIMAQEEIIENLIKTIRESNLIGNKKTLKYKKKMNETMGTTMTIFRENISNIEDNLRKIFQNEKNKFKYRICFLRSFVSKYIIIIIHTSNIIFQNIDNWIIKSVTLQSDAQNKIIHKLRSILKEKRLINEEKDIDSIELDSFEHITTSIQTERNNSSNNNKTENSMDHSEIYDKLDIGYLLNDYFINIELIENKDYQVDENAIKNIYDSKKFKLFLPFELINYNNINHKKINKLNYNLSEADFQYNIEKFNELYNKIKQYEIKKDIISEQILYEIFFKKYLFMKEIFEKENNKNNNNNDNPNNINIETKNLDKGKENNINNDVVNKYPFISKALRSLDFKSVKKLLSFFRIFIERINEEELKEDKNENETVNNTSRCHINSERTEKEINIIEYDNYINLSELFTILFLIGAKILTTRKENDLMEKLQDRIINDKFISKNDFYRCTFWFEEDFEYYKEVNSNNDNNNNNNNNSINNSKIIRQRRSSNYDNKFSNVKKGNRKKANSLINVNIYAEKNNKKNDENKIKDVLFSIWKDDKGNNFNIIDFLNVLKTNKYQSDLEENENDNYYDILFGE